MSSEDWSTRRMLIAERQKAIDNLSSDERLASLVFPLRGHAERLEAYCTWQLSQTLRIFGRGSLPELRAKYAALLASKPETPEGENDRQMEISVFEKKMIVFEQNLRSCEGAPTMMGWRLDTNEELQSKSRDLRVKIAELDRTLMIEWSGALRVKPKALRTLRGHALRTGDFASVRLRSC